MKILALEKLVENSSRGGKFIAPENLPVGSLAKGNFALPIDRPVDWPTVTFLTVVPPVGRDWIQREAALCRSTGRSTGAISREQSSLDGRPPGRPAHQPRLRARLMHVGRPDRSTDFCYGRPLQSTGRQPGQTILGFKNLGF